MDKNTVPEYLNIFNQITAQFFDLQNVAEFAKKDYILETGGQDRISVSTEDEKEIESFIQSFFFTCVTRMKLRTEKGTLIVPCFFRFLDTTMNNRSSSTTLPVEIQINSIRSPTLLKLYLISNPRY
jgi:hypothetical protein